MEFEKERIIMEKSWNFVKQYVKITSSEKVSCRTLVCPTASFLATGGFKFNYFKMHTWSTSMLLLLHSAFMLSVVKLLLKGAVGVCALNSHGNYIVDHGKIMELCFEFLSEP